VSNTDSLRSWDRLLDAFSAARDAASRGDRLALRGSARLGRTAIATLYTSLDPSSNPELTAHVHDVLDLCMTHLDRADLHVGASDLDAPIRLLEAMRPSLGGSTRAAPPESGFRIQSVAPARRVSLGAPRLIAVA
jgi:hypothetical protein